MSKGVRQGEVAGGALLVVEVGGGAGVADVVRDVVDPGSTQVSLPRVFTFE